MAVDHALHAADLLPPRSQAFAAVLCHAASWMQTSGDDETVRQLYRRYVTDGAVVPFAPTFGRQCPAPDFAAAPNARTHFGWRQARRFAATHRVAMLSGTVAVVVVLAAVVAWRRRRAL